MSTKRAVLFDHGPESAGIRAILIDRSKSRAGDLLEITQSALLHHQTLPVESP